MFRLVTDSMAAPAPRTVNLLVQVRNGQPRLTSSGAIAGSALTLDAAVRHAVRTAGIPLADAIRAATATPAALLGLDDRGHLEPGCRADLLALDTDLRVTDVMHHGKWLTAVPAAA